MNFNLEDDKILDKIIDCKFPRQLISHYRIIDLCTINLQDVFVTNDFEFTCWGTYYEDYPINNISDFFNDGGFYEQIAFITLSNNKQIIEKIDDAHFGIKPYTEKKYAYSNSIINWVSTLVKKINELDLVIWLSDAESFCIDGKWYAIVFATDQKIYDRIDGLISGMILPAHEGHSMPL